MAVVWLFGCLVVWWRSLVVFVVVCAFGNRRKIEELEEERKRRGCQVRGGVYRGLLSQYALLRSPWSFILKLAAVLWKRRQQGLTMKQLALNW